jgi:hypothetical protein
VIVKNQVHRLTHPSGVHRQEEAHEKIVPTKNASRGKGVGRGLKEGTITEERKSQGRMVQVWTQSEGPNIAQKIWTENTCKT